MNAEMHIRGHRWCFGLERLIKEEEDHQSKSVEKALTQQSDEGVSWCCQQRRSSCLKWSVWLFVIPWWVQTEHRWGSRQLIARWRRDRATLIHNLLMLLHIAMHMDQRITKPRSSWIESLMTKGLVCYYFQPSFMIKVRYLYRDCSWLQF